MMQEVMSLNEEKNVSFFSRFRNFVCKLDCEILALNKDYEKLPGTSPVQYYKGIEIMTSEIENLKILCDETDEKMCKVRQFGYFIQSFKELLSEYAKDIKLIEEHLEKFGYKIPEKELFASRTEALKGKGLYMGIDATQAPDVKSIELKANEASLEIAEENESQQTIKSGENFPKCSAETFGNAPTATPGQNNDQSFVYTASASAIKKVEGWLDNVEAEANLSFSSSPVLKNRHTERKLAVSPSKEEENSENISQINNDFPKFKSTDLENENTISTPDGPSLSSPTENYLRGLALVRPTNTPEEPVFSVIESSVRTGISPEAIETSHTPEEPQLSLLGKYVVKDSDSHTPEEPVLVKQHPSLQISGPKREGDLRARKDCSSGTEGLLSLYPLSPQLSDITKRALNIKSLRFSGSDTKSQGRRDEGTLEKIEKSVPKSFVSLTQYPSTEPQSPQMSDVTLKLLGIK